ncbi:MAG: phytanoyl-CoA dioxygenase family protein [Planctomycetota bacterium]|nr:phytanoyl-CoA dioxygenase family protein [Planctomycetota bacterium]
MQTPALLSPEQLAAFHREGFLVVDPFFAASDLQPVIDEVRAEVDARARVLAAEGRLSRTYEEEGFETRMAKICAETRAIQRSITNGQLSGPAFFRLITHPRLLDLAEQVCGPELIASSAYRLRVKTPNDTITEVPWHQDAGYFHAACDAGLVLTVWIALVDATPENGCLWVLPRRHASGKVWNHEWRQAHTALEIPEGELSKHGAVCCPVRKGGLLLMTNFTPHASFRNATEGVRWSMDLRYQGAALPTNAPIGRLEGEDTRVEADGQPLACYAPEADFLVRSRLRPEQVLRSAQAFERLRTRHAKRRPPNRFGVIPEAVKAGQ